MTSIDTSCFCETSDQVCASPICRNRDQRAALAARAEAHNVIVTDDGGLVTYYTSGTERLRITWYHDTRRVCEITRQRHEANYPCNDGWFGYSNYTSANRGQFDRALGLIGELAPAEAEAEAEAVSAPKTVLYTPGTVFGSLLGDVEGLSDAHNRELDQSTYFARGWAEAMSVASRDYRLGLDIHGEEVNAFTAAWRAHVIASMRGEISGRQSIEGAWNAWRTYGRIDHTSPYTRSNVIVDALTSYGWPTGVRTYGTPEGTEYQADTVELV